MRIAVRILALIVIASVTFVTLGQYAPEGWWIQDASEQMLRAIRASWMIDPITG